MTVGTVRAEDLRAAMVDRLVADHVAEGLVMRPEVEAALRTVPRHLFTPGAGLEEAYRDDHAVVTKRVGDEAVSSVSASRLIAKMLGQAADAGGGLAADGCWRSARVATTRRYYANWPLVGLGDDGRYRSGCDQPGHAVSGGGRR